MRFLSTFINLFFKGKKLGKKGEDIACDYLINKGHKILERNYRTKFGEIDIISEYKNKIVFIEVKTRKSLKFGIPELAVDKRKLMKIIKTATYYSKVNAIPWEKIRIDVISIEIRDDKPVIRHHENISL